MGVMRLGYVHIRVTDLEAARRHYVDTLGMYPTASASGKLYLKAWDEYDHHSVVLEEGGVGLVKLGYKCASVEDLEPFEARSQQFGATTVRMHRGENLAVGEGLRITLPSEHVVELYADIDYEGTATGTLNPDPYPRDLVGVGVPRVDHALVTCDDPEAVERFFSECLGFKASERVVTDLANPELLGSWMFCGNSPHDIAFIKGPNAKLHHFAYLLEDWTSILKAGDRFSMDDVPISTGPTRHGITRGTTIYFFDPAGNRNEVFAGGYQTFADFPTITWTADQLGKGIFYISRELDEQFTSVLT
ncbi:MAG: catechol 2,3-dioxygenase [Actinomycetota bacterium]|jgi:catechol 2,3-dioxygenase|nr:catechol 2,3-dioxygenase [Actinomycetota bacterium]